MKKIKVLILLILFCNFLPAFADTTATSTIATYVIGTITFDVKGVLTTTIDGTSGTLGNSLNINYAMTTNTNTNSLRLHAVVLNSSGSKINSIYSLGVPSLYLVFGNTDFPPTTAAISNCQQATSTATLNANAIAFPGTVTIDNGGNLSYSASGYYSFNIKKNTSNLNLTISTTPKTGTFDSATSLDEVGPYKVELYIDNIPG